MSKEEMITQIKDLILDRKSFITDDEETSEIFKKDVEALERSLKEIERLNNIINELEKWLKNKIDYFDKTVKDTILHEQMTLIVIYDYLQDLKGDTRDE